MTVNDFRRLALALPETAQKAHMDHPDFRVCGKIFVTLGYPTKGWGMVNLTPERQHYYSKEHPDVFVPVKGAWDAGELPVSISRLSARKFCREQSWPRGTTPLPSVSQRSTLQRRKKAMSAGAFASGPKLN